jgi:hypothetical protein
MECALRCGEDKIEILYPFRYLNEEYMQPQEARASTKPQDAFFVSL